MFGHRGRILRVDLSDRRAWVDEFDEGWARRHLGGRGVAAAILWEELAADTDPLGPDNRLILVSGPLEPIRKVDSVVYSGQPYGK